MKYAYKTILIEKEIKYNLQPQTMEYTIVEVYQARLSIVED